MAQECPVALHAPDLVGNTFVEQYYKILHANPDQVHRFYQDSSCLSRPGPDGAMTSVTTMQGINEMFLSLDYRNYHAEILTADSQYSYENGVMVLVTGFLSGEDTIKRKFTQTFFLAPQNNGFFVLNDIFRYVDGHEPTVISKYDHEPVDVEDYSTNEEIHAADPVDDAETATIQVIDLTAEDHAPPPQEKNIDIDNGDQTNNQSENGETPIVEKDIEIAEPQHVSPPNDVLPVAEKTSPVAKQDSQKKSYASMLKENPTPFQVKVPPKLSKSSPPTPVPTPTPTPDASVPVPSPAPAPAPAPSRNNSAERKNDQSAEGYSIFIRNLPCDATAEQLEAIVKSFGTIKPKGIQVRGFKDQQSCFAFVEFESASSVTSALKASPIAVGNRNATVEMKRRENNDGGRFRGGFRSDNFRPRGGFGGRGYGRNEFERRGDYSGRGRGSVGRGGVGNNGRSSDGNVNSYPRERGVYQN